VKDGRRWLDYGLSPSAWLLATVTAALTGWAGWGSLEGRVVAVVTALLVFVVVASQATNRRRIRGLATEAAGARRERERAEALLNSVPALVWRHNPSGERTFVAPAWLGVTGQSVEDALDHGWLECVHPDDRDRWQGARESATVIRRPFEVDYRLRRADGEYRWAFDRAAPIYDDEDQLCSVVGLTFDMAHWESGGSYPPDMTGNLLRMSQTINGQALAVADRCRELLAAKHQMEHDERLKHDYIAALADELRSPIEELHHVSEILDKIEISGEVGPHLERVRAVSDSLDDLLDRAVDLGEHETLDEPIVEEDVEVRGLLRDVVDDKQEAAGIRELTLTCVVDDLVPSLVAGDTVRYRWILDDLVSAAVTLAPKGRVTMRASSERLARGRWTMRFEISHGGEGVEPRAVARAFYPARSLRGEPAGLGLGPCKRLAERLGGRVGVDSREDGTVGFWFSIDASELNPNCDGRRLHGRLAQEAVRSNLGVILDLSMGGMRITTSKVPEGTVSVELEDDEETITMQAEVAWSRRVGFCRHEVGLRFVDAGIETTTRLSRLATRNRLRRVMEAA